MAATYSVEWYNDDGSPTWDTTTAHRFRIDKDKTADLVNAIPIPAGGTNRSNWHSFRLAWNAGGQTQIDNIRLYSDGTLGWGTGVTVVIGNVGVATASVESDPSSDGAVGTIMTTHASITSSSSLFAYTSGSPFTLDSTAYGASAGESDHAVIQTEVLSTAAQGVKSAETLTFLADEI